MLCPTGQVYLQCRYTCKGKNHRVNNYLRVHCRYRCTIAPMPETGDEVTPAGRTPLRNVRVPDDVWNAAKERSEREDVPLSQLIRRVLGAYADGAKTFKLS
jgi:hypothetical protein